MNIILNILFLVVSMQCFASDICTEGTLPRASVRTGGAGGGAGARAREEGDSLPQRKTSRPFTDYFNHETGRFEHPEWGGLEGIFKDFFRGLLYCNMRMPSTFFKIANCLMDKKRAELADFNIPGFEAMAVRVMSNEGVESDMALLTQNGEAENAKSFKIFHRGLPQVGQNLVIGCGLDVCCRGRHDDFYMMDFNPSIFPHMLADAFKEGTWAIFPDGFFNCIWLEHVDTRSKRNYTKEKLEHFLEELLRISRGPVFIEHHLSKTRDFTESVFQSFAKKQGIKVSFGKVNHGQIKAPYTLMRGDSAEGRDLVKRAGTYKTRGINAIAIKSNIAAQVIACVTEGEATKKSCGIVRGYLRLKKSMNFFPIFSNPNTQSFFDYHRLFESAIQTGKRPFSVFILEAERGGVPFGKITQNEIGMTITGKNGRMIPLMGTVKEIRLQPPVLKRTILNFLGIDPASFESAEAFLSLGLLGEV